MHSREVFCLVTMLLLFVGCTKKLDTDTKKTSYAIGLQFAQNLKNQNVEYDQESLALAIADVKSGKPVRLKTEELQSASQKMQEAVVKKQMVIAQENLGEAKKFLNQNKTRANVRTTASGLQYVMVEEGKGTTPVQGDRVKVNYRGALTNGDIFDNTFDNKQPVEIPVSGVIKGWSEALQMMKPGGKMKLFIPPELAYGPNPRPGIPANSVLVFDIELLGVLHGKVN